MAASIAACAAAFSLGAKPFATRAAGGQFISISGDWQDEPEYADIAALTNFFNTQLPNWWQMSRSTTIPSGSRVYALSDPTVGFAVYSAQGSTVTLNIPNPPTGHQWLWAFYDPRLGFPIMPDLIGGGTTTFTKPDSQDWALVFTVF